MTGERRGYRADDLVRLKTVSDPQISPDGSRVAYVVGEIDREADDYRSAIWIVPTTGGEPVRFTFGGKNDSQPRWSPDSRRLAFVSDRAGNSPQLFVMPAGGGEARKLTDLSNGASEHTWSPDGTRIAFLSPTGGPEKPKPGATPPPRVITTLKHKFNGQGFFDGSHAHIFVVPSEGGETRQLTDGDWDDGQVAWSPDSSRIAFISARHESRDRDNLSDVWVVPADGGESRAITDRFGPCGAPAFSPDGRLLAFSGNRDVNDSGGRNTLVWLVPAGGGEPRSLTGTLDRSIVAGGGPGTPNAPLFWSPNGAAIVARLHDGAGVRLYRFGIEDGASACLLGGERIVEAFSLAADGRLACAIGDPSHPTEIYAVSPNGADERRLTRTNDDLLGEIRLPESEPVSVRLPDGAVIEGWVIKPLDFDPARRYPLVLDVHGGPHGAFMHNFRASYLAFLPALGCAILQMNPRGSTGWGEQFARYLHGGRGERDLPELLAAVDEVIAWGWVDPERLGITGYSYGGYMTAWAISQTDRFKAAVWGAGTADLYSHFGYTDMTAPRYHEMGGSPWEQRETYLRQSPISYVQQITTPLLMLHGENDLRCNPHQADEFFTALKYFGKEVVLIRYPGENHMLRARGKPSHRLDYDERLQNWFAERLAFGGVEEHAREAVPAG